MFISKKKDYKKLYLPGYSGHVPRKNDLFGITAGDANQILVKKEGADKFFSSGGHRPTHWDKHQHRSMSQGPNLKADRIKYTNWSKKASNWVCGPAHEIRMQHIPGYKGHVHGVIPENIHGKAYARATATALNKRQQNVCPGQKVSARETFTSLNRKEYNPVNFRRYLERPDAHGNKDYEDYSKNLNEEMYDHKTKVIQHTSPIIANTICSKTGTNFYSTRQTARQARFSVTQSNFHPEDAELKPKLLESKVVSQKGFFNLSNGFKRVFANDESDKKVIF